jgi:hypothetical protein
LGPRFLHKDDVTDSLRDLLADPIRLEVIRDDPVIVDVLNKILVSTLLNFFSPSPTTRPNKLEYLSLETLSSQVLEFASKVQML